MIIEKKFNLLSPWMYIINPQSLRGSVKIFCTFFLSKIHIKIRKFTRICSVHNFFWILRSKNFLVLKGFYFLYIFRELNEKFVEAGFPPIQHTYDVWHLAKVNICYMLDTILLAFLC
jgi:hypothetical protein